MAMQVTEMWEVPSTNAKRAAKGKKYKVFLWPDNLVTCECYTFERDGTCAHSEAKAEELRQARSQEFQAELQRVYAPEPARKPHVTKVREAQESWRWDDGEAV